jgi:hypothetical protein
LQFHGGCGDDDDVEDRKCRDYSGCNADPAEDIEFEEPVEKSPVGRIGHDYPFGWRDHCGSLAPSPAEYQVPLRPGPTISLVGRQFEVKFAEDMAEKSEIKDIREIVDASSDYIFVRTESDIATRMYVVKAPLPTRLLALAPPDFSVSEGDSINCFLLGRGGGGVYSFLGTTSAVAEEGVDEAAIVIDIDLASVIYRNRRQFFRVLFAPPEKAELKQAGSKSAVSVKVHDFSPGGARIRCSQPLDTALEYVFEFKPLLKSIRYGFEFPAHVVREESTESGYVYGLSARPRSGPEASRMQQEMVRFCSAHHRLRIRRISGLWKS